MKKTIGFFGGSFDPIHFGHIHLAVSILEEVELDEILFCPAWQSPLKGDAPPKANAHHRLEMLKLAIAEIPRCSVTSIELDRQGPSYTVETLQALQEPGIFYRLLLSEESASRLFEWKNADEILHLAPPLIGSRGENHSIPPVLRQAIIETPRIDISSTEIRHRLKENLYCGHLIPAKALDYIRQYQLYL